MTDQLGYRGRIAIVVPSTNTSCQPESEMLRPPGVTNHTGRISIKERPLTTEQAFMEHVQAMRDGMRAGIDQVMTCQPTHVIMGVALEAFWGGVKAADELQAELAQRSGVGVSMGSTATVAALRALGAKNFDEAGFPVKRLIGMKCPSPVQIAHTTPQQVIAALRELDGDDVDALVQVGTNLAAIRLCAAAEQFFAKPVLAINATTYWDALRRSGIQDRVHGYGTLLEKF